MREKKIHSRGAALTFGLLLLVLLAAAPAAATTWDVSEGDSIQATIDNASAGDTVTVHAGTYAEALTIDKTLTLEGIGNPVIRQSTSNDTVKISGADSVFRGFTINHTESMCFGIHISADGVLVENNVLENCNEGIWIADVQNTTVRKNIIRGCYGWVGLYDGPASSNNWIYLNDFISNTGGQSSALGSSQWYSPENLTYSYNGSEQTGPLGNYYDTYTGTDADNDGVGDTPEGNDAYPLMTPSTNYLEEQPTGPIADFTADVTNGDVPLTVQFTDTSTGADEWAWDFENDGVVDSTEQNPTHTYDIPGTYTVSLTATNSSGSNSEVKTDYITVTGAIAPVADFTADVTSGGVPLTVRFTDNSTNSPTAWSWDFGDGTNATEQDPTHTYNTSGTYTVDLTVSNSAGNDSLVKPDFITISGTFYVDASGGGNFTTIQAAIDAVPDGSTLIIRNGTYVENIVVNKALTITSENGPATAILRPAQADDDTVAVTAPDVVISGLAIARTDKKGAGISCTADGCTLQDNIISGHSNGVRLQGANDTVVTRNTCTDNTYGMMLDTACNTTISENICNDSTNYGIMVQVSSSCNLLDNIVTESGKRGIWIDYSNDNLLVNNTVNRTGGEGIKVQGSTGNTLINNTANENSDGYFILRASNTTLLNNTAENNTNGIRAYGDNNGRSDNCLISDNTLKNNTNYGIYVCARNSTYEKNTVSGSTSGIYLSRTTANDTIRKNTVSGNDQGMTIEWSGSAGPGTGHQVYLNAFAGNQENIANSENNTCTATISWNTSESKEYIYKGTAYAGYLGNYYDDYAGTDTEGVGIGDTPYALPGGLGNDTVPLVATPDNYTVVGRAPDITTADFTATPTTGTAPLTVQFTDNSTNSPAAWSWDFGDGNTSTEQNPTHTYTSTGAYTVNLKVSNLPGSNTMTKKNFICALFEAPAIDWQHTFGGNGTDSASAINQAADGGYIVAGSTSSTVIPGYHGGEDAWVAKLDADGNLVWQKCFGGSNDDYASDIRQCSDGGYIIAGYTKSSDGDVSDNHGNYDAWAVKLDADGNLLWQKCLGGSNKDYTYAVRQCSDGGYIVAGTTYSDDGDVSGKRWRGYAVWVVKLDADGNLTWQKCLGGSNVDYGSAVQQCSDGGYIVAGEVISTNGDVSGHHSCKYTCGNWRFDAWIMKLDADGNLTWQKCLGGTSEDRTSAVRQCSDGGYIVAGYTESTDGDVTANHGGFDAWVVKLDADSNLVWQRCLGGSGSDYAHSVDQTADGGYIVAGYTSSTDGDVSGNHGNYDSWVVKLDADGNPLWQKCLGGTSSESAYDIISTTDGGIAIAASTNSNDGDVTDNHGKYDAWVVKLEGDGTVSEPVGLSFSPAMAETGVGGTTEVSIVADSLPTGLSGYNLTVSLDDPAVANITAVNVPTWASINATGTLPSGSVWVQAADLNDAVSTDAANVTLATLTLTGISAGTANITASVTRMDGDDGSAIGADVTDGRVLVSSAATVPGCENPPSDLDGDGICDDVNGNGLFDFDDVVTFFTSIEWVAGNEPTEAFDVNGNSRIEFADLVGLYKKL